MSFLRLVREKVKLVGLDESLLQRPVNEGFSGGEKKRLEIYQMLMLEPRFMILDETDSGLDIDALKVVAEGVESQDQVDYMREIGCEFAQGFFYSRAISGDTMM